MRRLSVVLDLDLVALALLIALVLVHGLVSLDSCEEAGVDRVENESATHDEHDGPKQAPNLQHHFSLITGFGSILAHICDQINGFGRLPGT